MVKRSPRGSRLLVIYRLSHFRNRPYLANLQLTMQPKLCDHCNQPFRPHNKRQHYCVNCNEPGKRVPPKPRQPRPPTPQPTQKRVYGPYVCLQCHSEFTSNYHRSIKPKFCSTACHHAYLDDWQKQKYEAAIARNGPRPPKKCGECGNPIITGSRQRRYCSDECRHTAQKRLERLNVRKYRSK